MNEESKLFAKRVLDIDASGVRKMFDMAKTISDPIDLTVGQPDFSVPEEVKEEAIKAIRDDKNKYTSTQGFEELRVKVKEKLEKKNNIKADLNQIFITSAVSGGLTLAFLSLFEEGDEILITDPYFVSYKQITILSGAKPVFVDIYPDFKLDIRKFEEKITEKTKAIILNSPSNPTGIVYSQKDLEPIINLARKHNLVLISDEVYEDFIYNNKHFSPGSVYEKTITLNGFSKSHAMTGWRVGYIVAPKEMVEQMMKIQQYAYVCAPTPFQYGALKALDIDVENEVENYKKKRELLWEGLKNHYDFVRPQGAFYAFMKYPYNGNEFIEKAVENQLLVVPGNVFSEINTHFRISFAVSDEVLEKGIEVLRKIAK